MGVLELEERVLFPNIPWTCIYPKRILMQLINENDKLIILGENWFLNKFII